MTEKLNDKMKRFQLILGLKILERKKQSLTKIKLKSQSQIISRSQNTSFSSIIESYYTPIPTSRSTQRNNYFKTEQDVPFDQDPYMMRKKSATFKTETTEERCKKSIYDKLIKRAQFLERENANLREIHKKRKKKITFFMSKLSTYVDDICLSTTDSI